MAHRDIWRLATIPSESGNVEANSFFDFYHSAFNELNEVANWRGEEDYTVNVNGVASSNEPGRRFPAQLCIAGCKVVSKWQFPYATRGRHL